MGKLSMFDVGRRLTTRDIARAEAKMEVALTKEHRQFLLKHNGGRLHESWITLPGKPKMEEGVDTLYGIGGNFDLVLCQSYLKDILGRMCVPIGQNAFGDTFVQFLMGPGKQEIWFLEHEDPTNMRYVSPSLASFLKMLRED